MKKVTSFLFLALILIQSMTYAEEKPKVEMVTYYLGLIHKGPNWSPEETPERLAIHKGHMENIERLGKEGKLVVAGPVIDDGDLRGIFVYKVATIEEAKALAATDPAVKAGRLVVEIHPWMVMKGVLP